MYQKKAKKDQISKKEIENHIKQLEEEVNARHAAELIPFKVRNDEFLQTKYVIDFYSHQWKQWKSLNQQKMRH